MDEKLYQQEFEKANRQQIEAEEKRLEQEHAAYARVQTAPPSQEVPVTIGDILGRIDTILVERDYIRQVIESINTIPVNDSPNGGFDGQARGQALEAVVKCRETTNQKVLALLEKLYDDFVRPAQNPQMHNPQMHEERKVLAQKMAANLTSNPDIGSMNEQQLSVMFDRIEKLLG